MSNENKNSQIEPNNKDNFIEEKIGNTNIGFSKVFELYDKRILSKGEEKLFEENDLIELDISEKKKFRIEGVFNDLLYDGEIVNFPITVSFEKYDKNNTYKIYTKKYFDKIYKEFNFSSPLLLIGDSCEKYDPDKFYLFSLFKQEKNKKIKIYEKKEDNYNEFYSEIIKPLKEYNSSNLTPNFKYYFSSPKNDCKMKFSITYTRKEAFNSIFTFINDKIHSIYGPYGSGKTTSLILMARSASNICYLNLNALYKNKGDINLWKFDLFLKELYNLFREEKKEKDKKEEKKEKDKKEEKKGMEQKEDRFTIIKKKILKSKNFWDAVLLAIDYCINNKINSIFILDQYKEEIDPKFHCFQKIKDCINNEKNIFVKIVVASSTNNLDIRQFIINKYIEKQSKEDFINDYYYIDTMFKLSDIDGLINDLSHLKKKMLEEYFSNIPSYFYTIYESNEESLNLTLEEIKETIIKDIENFYKINALSYEDLSFIVKNYPKIEVNCNGENENISVKMEEDIVKKFIRILPIKYFIFEIKEESIVKISYYFKLAKICLLEFIFKRIFELFEQPKFQIPERTIGDLLELIVIENFKNNSNEKIDQICKVDSIWEMKNAEGFDKSKVYKTNILIIQKIEQSKSVDFGILLEGETLVLVQCKKALRVKPKEYITITKIFNHKNDLQNSFKKHFDCDIKKIKLFYLTGIYFTNRENNLYHTWSKNDETFGVLEEITKENNIPLVFFDVEKKNLLLKNDQNTFDFCTITSSDSLICNEEKYNFVKIESDEEELRNTFDDMKSYYETKGFELFNNSNIEAKSENKDNIEMYESYLNRKLKKDKRIVIKNPDNLFLCINNENLLTSFKINEKQCISYYDENKKKMRYAEIKDGKTKEFEYKDMKIYYLGKKKERSKDRKKK